MKEFIGAVTAFFLCAAAVVFSLFYTADSINKINASLSTLPLTADLKESEDTSEEYLKGVFVSINILNDRMGKLSLFISQKELDELESMMYAVAAAIDSRDEGHYAASLSALRERLGKLAASERLSFSSVF